MNTSVAALLILAVLTANLPFMTERRLLVLPAPKRKGGGWHVLELVILYGLTGVVAHFFEQRMMLAQTQHWEFYVVTLCLFIVLASPGFVFRYLWRR